MNVSGLTPETSYTIEVAAVDIYGNVGTYSQPFKFVTTADKVSPIIAAFGPAPNYFNSSIPLTITAQDDFVVSNVTLQASQSNEKDAKWSDVAVIKNEQGGAYFRKLYLRAFATDVSNNKGELSAVYEYVVKRTPPAAPTSLKASSDSNAIELSWEPFEDKAESAAFSLYRSDKEDGEYTEILTASSSLNYFDRSAETGKTYFYKLTAIDAAGNESSMRKTRKSLNHKCFS